MDYIKILKNSALFYGLSEEEINKALKYSKMGICVYKKGTYVFNSGDVIKNIGLVVEGTVMVEKEDYYGNRSIIAVVREGDIFGEVYACIKNGQSDVSVSTIKDSKILMVNVEFILSGERDVDGLSGVIERNLVSILAQKAYILTKKISHITKRTTREKLMSYLSETARDSGSGKFKIPFNRQELADYLCVDRSAMSNELSKMRKEGIIEYNKNYFEITDNYRNKEI